MSRLFYSALVLSSVVLVGGSAMGQSQSTTTPNARRTAEIKYWFAELEKLAKVLTPESMPTSRGAIETINKEQVLLLVDMASLYGKAGDRAKAVSLMEKAETLAGGTRDPAGMIEEGLVRGWVTLDRQVAMKHLQILKQKAVRNPLIEFRCNGLSEMLKEQKDLDEYLASIKDVDVRLNATAQRALVIAQTNPEKARKYTDKIISQAGQLSERYRDLVLAGAARVLYRVGDEKKAEEVRVKLVDPATSLSCAVDAANYYLDKKDLAHARKVLAGSSERFMSGMWPVQAPLIEALARAGDVKQVEAMFEKVEASDNLTKPDMQLVIALALWHDNQKQAALETVKKAQEGITPLNWKTTSPPKDVAEHCFSATTPGALVLIYNGQYKEALKLVGSDKFFFRSQTVIGELVNRGRYEELRQWYSTLNIEDRFLAPKLVLRELLNDQTAPAAKATTQPATAPATRS